MVPSSKLVRVKGCSKSKGRYLNDHVMMMMMNQKDGLTRSRSVEARTRCFCYSCCCCCCLVVKSSYKRKCQSSCVGHRIESSCSLKSRSNGRSDGEGDNNHDDETNKQVLNNSYFRKTTGLIREQNHLKATTTTITTNTTTNTSTTIFRSTNKQKKQKFMNQRIIEVVENVHQNGVEQVEKLSALIKPHDDKVPMNGRTNDYMHCNEQQRTLLEKRTPNNEIKIESKNRQAIKYQENRTIVMKMCHPSSISKRLTNHLDWSRLFANSSMLILTIQCILASCLLIASTQVVADYDSNSMPSEAGLLAAAAGADDDLLKRQPAASQPVDHLQLRSGELKQQQRQRSTITGQNEPKRTAESNTKFTRVNELDVFLDDMNHNELRAVATGKPIGDYLFQARPLTGAAAAAAATGQSIQHERLRTLGQPSIVSTAPVNSSSSSSSGPKTSATATTTTDTNGRSSSSLDESQSEQQIYSECALILQRTYVKNIDNPKHQLVPFGKTEQACIGYKHIDKAVEQAKHMLKFKELTKRRKKQKPKLPAFDIIHKTLEPPQDLVAALGELNMAITQILANQFDLSNDELLNGLPLIDMSKTKFWPLCPALVKQDIKCEISRHRTLTGHCNNLKHPTWGAAMTPFARYLPPVHPDGIWIPRKSIITETVFDISPASPRHTGEPSQLRPVFGEPHLSPMEPSQPLAPQPPSILSHNHNRNELGSMMHEMDHLSSSASVQFASHVRPEEAELANMMQMNGSPLLPTGVTLPPPTTVASSGLTAPSNKQTTPATIYSMDGMIIPNNNNHESHNHNHNHHSSYNYNNNNQLRHYHESHSPKSPYMASSYPIRSLASRPNALTRSTQNHKLLTSEAQHQPHHHNDHDHDHHDHHDQNQHQRQHHQGHQARSVALDLPSARLVTSIVHRDVDLPNHDLSILFMSWGQLLDHDMTRAAQSPPSIKCCTEDGKPKHKLCLPIQVPHDDPFYSKHNVKCLEFRRTLAGLRPNCVLGPRVHQNAITSPIDANFVYGSSQAQSDALRLFKGGRLRDRNWFKTEGLKPLLPAQDVDPDLECIARPKDLFCFLAGDVRVNEQTHLTVLHTIYMREHNRMADQLADLNPHWDDERIFQETRHIMAAGVQHVMINEYIPLLIGKKMADLYNLTAVSAAITNDHPHSHHIAKAAGLHWHGYDPSVTTSVSNSFAAAAFRQGHTFIQSTFERYNKFHEFVSSERLRHLFKRPFLLYQPGVMDELVAGMINQASQSYDPFLSEEISGHLFQPPELAFGHDLAAINLQRGREQGLPGYNLFREWCGLPRAETFDQLEPYLTNHTAFHYSRLYKHVDDIDLWSGGISERKLPGASIGPTFACIIARQFSNTRRGDRFWYENPGLPSSFTPNQLMEIRKITLAKILCANSDDLPTFQRWALRLAHPVLNPRIPCNQLPQMDLRAWLEE